VAIGKSLRFIVFMTLKQISLTKRSMKYRIEPELSRVTSITLWD
jgi:hypothetical protein